MRNFLTNVAALTRAVLDELAAHIPGESVYDDPTDATAVCVAPGRRHPATEGHLCRWHLDELGKWLRDIETEAARLHPVPSMQTVYDSGGGSLASHRSPAVLDVLVYTDPRSTAHGHRHTGPTCARCAHDSCEWIRADADEREANAERLLSVLGVLSGWADRVRVERWIGQPVRTVIDRVPGHRGPICLDCEHPSCVDMRWVRHIPIPPTVASERDLLTRQLVWIADQPWVGDMRRELSDLRAQLLRVNRNEDDRPLPGWCDWTVDGTECGGDLWPADTAHTTGYESTEGYRAVVCERNPKHRWEGIALARLSLIVAEQQRTEGNAS